MSTIVVGIDGSTSAQAALDWAVAEATRRGASVRVIGAFDYAVVDVLGANIRLHPFADDPAEAFEHVLAAVELAREGAPDVHLEPEAVEGDPGRVLCESAKDADLLVVGRHGTKGGAHRLGSVASYVTHHATCPVAVVPEPG